MTKHIRYCGLLKLVTNASGRAETMRPDGKQIRLYSVPVDRMVKYYGACEIASDVAVHGLSDKQATELVDGAWTARTRSWLAAAAELDSMLEGVAKLHKPSMWKHIRLHFYRRTYGGTAVSFSALIQKTRS